MQIMRHGGFTYSVCGLTAEELRYLAALTDFPLLARQPKGLAEFCSALYTCVEDALDTVLGEPADELGMTNHTTIM